MSEPGQEWWRKELTDLRVTLEHAERALKAREDDNVLMAQERAKEVGQYERLCDTLRTRLAEAEKKLEWVTADYATTVDVLNLVKQQRDEAEQRGRALELAMSAHHQLDEGDPGRSCMPYCWVCRALSPQQTS